MNAQFSPKGQQVVYFIRRGQQYKIGVTNNLRSRFSTIKTSNPDHVEVYRYFKVYDRNIEYTLHELFKKHRGRGEWFTLTEEDVRKAGNLIRYLNLHVKVNRDRESIYREEVEDKLEHSKEKLAKAIKNGASQEVIDKKLDKIKRLTRVVYTETHRKKVYGEGDISKLKANLRKRKSRLKGYIRDNASEEAIQRQKIAIAELESRLVELTSN